MGRIPRSLDAKGTVTTAIIGDARPDFMLLQDADDLFLRHESTLVHTCILVESSVSLVQFLGNRSNRPTDRLWNWSRRAQIDEEPKRTVRLSRLRMIGPIQVEE